MQTLQQYAALPYVETAGGVLVLLISSRDTGRWVIPKGWPKAKLTPFDLAAREAREEAGISGVIASDPIGSYDYVKRLHLLSWARCRVDVFPLRAEVQALDWDEKPSRRQLWCLPDEAARLVRERSLRALLRQFAVSAR